MKIVLFNDLVFDIEHKGQNKENKELYFVDIKYKDKTVNENIINMCDDFEKGTKKDNILIRNSDVNIIKIID